MLPILNIFLRFINKKNLVLILNEFLLSIIFYLTYFYYNLTFVFIISIISFIAFLLFYNTKDYRNNAILLSFLTFGAFIAFYKESIISIVLGLELVSFSTFLLFLINNNIIETNTKYFLLSSFSIASLLFGLLLASSNLSIEIALFGSLIAFFGISFESGIFPLNIFLPNIYKGLRSILISILGSFNKLIFIFVLIQLVSFVFLYNVKILLYLEIASVITMFYGNILALKEKNLKKLIAYSSIAQMGYVIIGLVAYNNIGYIGSIIQAFSYSLSIFALVILLLVLERENRYSLNDIKSLYYRNPFLGFVIAIALISLLGIPPTFGFDGKLFLLLSILISGNLILAIIFILNIVISAYYYLNMLRLVFEEDSKKTTLLYKNEYLVLFIIAFLLILLGLLPNIIIKI